MKIFSFWMSLFASVVQLIFREAEHVMSYVLQRLDDRAQRTEYYYRTPSLGYVNADCVPSCAF